MASYLSFPVLEELVRFADEDSIYEDAVKAMASGVLNHYFTAADGYSVAPEQNRNNNYPDFTILRIRRRFPGDRGFVDHAMVEAKKSTDYYNSCMEQLENALEQSVTDIDRCWAVLIHGIEFYFFEYHKNLPSNARMVPWGAPAQQGRNTYHGRHDATTIAWMLQHMAQNNPPTR